MDEIKPEEMWAIYNPRIGFYYGTNQLRRDMIALHIKDKGYRWDFCKKRGDVAVKVLISAIVKKEG